MNFWKESTGCHLSNCYQAYFSMICIQICLCLITQFNGLPKIQFDLLRLPASRVEPYSCPSKLAYIREGVKKFSEVSANKLVDNESTQNLLIKDVELAEVMTDNNPEVAEILTELVHLDEDPEMVERERKAELAAKRKRKRRGAGGCGRRRKGAKK